MFKHFWGIGFAFLITGCMNTGSDGDALPHPDVTGIDTSGLPLKMGNFISILVDNNFISGIVLDIDKDEGGLWYGVCFSDAQVNFSIDLKASEGKLFGRQIPSGLLESGCVDCFDLTYLNEKAISNDIKIIATLPIKFQQINIGAFGAVETLEGFKSSFELGIEQKEKTSN